MSVIDEVMDELSKLDVQVIYGDFNRSAFYHPYTNNIYINYKLKGIEKRNEFLHEAGHAILHLKYKILYHTTVVSHLKMESEANRFMIKKIVQQYLEDYGNDIPVNIYDFMRNNQIESKNELLVKSAFLNARLQHPGEVHREMIN